MGLPSRNNNGIKTCSRIVKKTSLNSRQIHSKLLKSVMVSKKRSGDALRLPLVDSANSKSSLRPKKSPSPLLGKLRHIYVSRSAPSKTQTDLWWGNGFREEPLLLKSPTWDRGSFLQHRRKRRRVQFAPKVVVKEIPHRSAYSTDMKEAMWNTRSRIRQEARRNSIEFAWESYNWKDAPEEDEFLIISGEMVHPAHIREADL